MSVRLTTILWVPWVLRKLATAMVTLAVVASSGCMSVGVTAPDGTRVSVARVGTTTMEGFEVRRTAEGFELVAKGYQSEGTATVEAAFKGLGQGLRGGQP